MNFQLPSRLRGLQVFALLLSAVQLAFIFPASLADRQRRASYFAEFRKLNTVVKRGITGAPAAIAPLRQGEFPPPVSVRTDAGTETLLLTPASGATGVLFVSSCAPCVADLITDYDQMWRRGFPVCVVAYAPTASIRLARQSFGWRLPIYSDYQLPRVSKAYRVSYRPTTIVFNKRGRVAYSQGIDERREEALRQVSKALSPSDVLTK
jgi:hypothetical protein